MQGFLDQTYFGNSVQLYLTAAGTFIISLTIILIFKKIILSRLNKWAERTDTKLDDFLIRGIEKTILPLLYIGALYIGINVLKLSPRAVSVIHIIWIILITFFALRAFTSALKFMLNAYLARKGQASREKELRGIITILSILIWTLGFIFLLSNLGYDISAVIAGLGIGGIAIALAAQTILGDLFAYFVIFFDRPFEIGDFIIVGDKLGAVEYIGIKTTRLRSLGGEQLVFSNKDLTNSRIHNYKKMERRRVLFKLGVIYQTPLEKVKEIPPLVRKAIEDQKDTTFDRAHFASYGDFSLNFEFVYYVHGADYNKYMDTQQAINFRIYEEFENRGIEFAYPTQTLFLNKENGNGNIEASSEVVRE